MKTSKTIVAVFALFLLYTSPSAQKKIDPFELALKKAGISKEDLAFRPKTYWARFPGLDGIPHLPRLFSHLYAEPLRCHDVAELMALSVKKYLDPKYMNKKPMGVYKTAYFCGFEKKIGGFRAYTSCPPPAAKDKEPLLSAIKGLFDLAGRPFTYRVLNKEADWPRRGEKIREQINDWPLEVRKAIARAVTGLGSAWSWSMKARRKIDAKDLLKAWSIRDLSETQFDGMDYYECVEDIVAAMDERSLIYGAMKATESLEILASELNAAIDKKPKWQTDNILFQTWTPCGRIVVAGTGRNVHAWTDAIIVIDLGGNDEWHGPAGASPRCDLPIGTCLDLSGDDLYENRDPATPSQGAGILGTGVLLDVKGNDVYKSTYICQGAGQMGVGILADLSGNDKYEGQVMAQGAGIFGIGVIMDAAGNDSYTLHGGDGQGYGGVGGVGTLTERGGNDTYFAEPSAKKCPRADYHGEKRINYSYAQGAGIGRRGDLSDGHSWAGGMGTLIDLSGNDRYEAGGWAQANSYWFGIGMLWDGKGDDVYLASQWSQASGAHFGISAFFEEAGNDRYLAYECNKNNLAFAHDYTQAIFVDKSGNDIYFGGRDSLAFAIRMSHALFLDLSGDDEYHYAQKFHALGETDAPKRAALPGLEFSYEIYVKQIALFLDASGNDKYHPVITKNGKAHTKATFRDSLFLLRPKNQTRHLGIFLDLCDTPLSSPPWLGPNFK